MQLGSRLGHYEILDRLGAGGMGEVYRARDTSLDRDVAIKVLPDDLAGDSARLARFEREAKLLASLNHPNVATIFGFEESDGVRFIAMELVEGQSLAEHIATSGPIETEEALRIARRIAMALEAAHEAGVVHRDLKPANVQVAPDGTVKVLDFGIAKAHEPAEPSDLSDSPTAMMPTEAGVIMGTAPYMSPEQARGRPLDKRTDIWAFGCVLYERLTGSRAFDGESVVDTLSAVLEREPDWSSLPATTPAELRRLLEGCLQEDADLRLHDIQDARIAIDGFLAGSGLGPEPTRPMRRWPVAAAAVLLIVAAGVWLLRASRARQVREEVLPEIARLVDSGMNFAALQMAREAGALYPDAQEVVELQETVTAVPVTTSPEGASIYVKDYQGDETDWALVGQSPIEALPVIGGGFLSVRAVLDGYPAVERIMHANFAGEALLLDREATAPAGMVGVDGGAYSFGGLAPVDVADFWLDWYEVTNAAFKAFVDAAGYETPDYWKHPIERDDTVLSWGESRAVLVDATGRPGPSTWELGSYPDGAADEPVRGVSWYEAAAYAEFVGKSLPTVYHWRRGAEGSMGPYFPIQVSSNFGGEGPAPVGARRGVSVYGHSDMAGNVKEWCWNAAADGKRYILGGAWNEASYQFSDPDAQAPLSRAAKYGLRLAEYPSPVDEALAGPVVRLARDYSLEEPVNDEVFRAFESMYAYEDTPLNAALESVDETSAHWRKERISFDTAYPRDRLIAHVYLPLNAEPPFQTVVYFPGGSSIDEGASPDLGWSRFVSFLVRSGRAVMFPMYSGMYERWEPSTGSDRAWRDMVIRWRLDLGRSIDYLETREDIDVERLAFYGLSMGAAHGPIFTALEPRFKASVMLAGGFYLEEAGLPETEPLNFASRSTIPTIMLNGRHDFYFPLETSQRPLFELLGTPPEHKRHVLFDMSHMPPRNSTVKETLSWLDEYLGPVEFARPQSPP